MERDGTAVKNKTMNLNKIKLNRYINIKTVIFMLLFTE